MRFSRRSRRQFERFLLLTGIGCVLIWICSIAGPAVYQDWTNWGFDQKLHGQPATMGRYLGAQKNRLFASRIQPPPAQPPVQPPAGPKPNSVLQPGSVLGRLAIPRLHLTSMVREGAGETTLAVALGHIPGTALPGQTGNVGVAGHRDKLFRELRNIQNNDLIQLQTLSGTYSYRVEGTQIVTPRDVGVLKAGPNPELTLVTCYPFYYVGPAPNRYIVKAKLISNNTRDNTPEAQVVAQTAPAAKNLPVAAPRAIPARVRKPTPTPGKTVFSVSTNHSRQLAPGIAIGLMNTDVRDHRLTGWIWLASQHRTVWLRNQSPVTIYGALDGKRRLLVITSISRNSIAGYVVAPKS